MDGSDVASKFKGCLLGSLMGDCVGCVFEVDYPNDAKVQRYFDGWETPVAGGGYLNFFFSSFATSDGRLLYSDDTEMTHCIASSLVQHEKVDVRDLAERFVKAFFDKTTVRIYGAHVEQVFNKLRKSGCRDPLGPAKKQFGGAGSYGNGSAMRIAPVALFFCGQGTEVLADNARLTSVITHTHRNGINGAILQCLAIEQALWLDPRQPLDTDAFLERLIAKMEPYEKVDEGHADDPQPYIGRLRYALSLLQKERSGEGEISVLDVLTGLGNGVAANRSVVTSIFCFLRAQQGPIPGVNTNNPLRRAVQYAVSLRGDMDTIGAMTGAITGAYLGYSPEYFKESVFNRFEGLKDAVELAEKLYSKSQVRKQ